MANIELQGFEPYLRQIKALKDASTAVCKAVVYPGAKILADTLRQETEALPTISDRQAVSNYRSGAKNAALSDGQKAGLLSSFGVTAIRKDRAGMVQCSVGFSGYNGVQTRHFTRGQPNAEVARSLEKGTSYLQRNAFVSRAVRAARDAAVAAMKAEADAQIEKIMTSNE
jgi:hypothetical protein